MEENAPSDSSDAHKISRSGHSLVNPGIANGSIGSAKFPEAVIKSSLSSLAWNKACEMSSRHLHPSVPFRDFPDNFEPLLNKHGGTNAFSTSLPVLLGDKLKRTSSVGQPMEAGVLCLDRELGEEAIGSVSGEIILKTIGHLLPDDEEELLAGIAEGFDRMNLNHTTEENDEFDLFSSGGGLEMDGETQECFGVYMNNPRGIEGFPGNSMALHGTSSGPGSVVGEHPYGEHPSRTLFVRNINSNVEDSELRALFEQYGDIRTLYTTCKHRGFVMISYYDIRSARSAMRGLQNKPLRRRKLDIHFSIPKDNPSDKDINQGTLVVFNLDASVSNDDLRQIFGQYGEVKEIRETPHKRHHKFIEFYDVRAAEAALRALNRSDIAGKRIKLEPSRPGGARRSLVQQLTQELEQEETRPYRQQSTSPNTNSPPGHPSSWGRYGSPADNGLSRNLHHSLGTLVPGMNKPLPVIPVTLPHSSSVRVGTIGSHLGRTNQVDASFSSVPTGVKPIPLHHAHSLPEYRNGTMQFYNHPVSIRGAAAPHGVHDGVGGIQLARSTSGAGNDSLFENAPGAMGIPNDGSLRRFNSVSGGGTSLSGHQFLWGTSSPYQQNSSSVAWPMTGMAHGFNPVAHSQPQSFRYTGTQGHFVNTILPSHRHHVGSAPSGDPSLLERQLGYFAESPDTSFFNSVARGAVGVPGSTASTLMNGGQSIIKSGSIGSNGGYETAVASNVGIMSPGHRTHLFQATGMPLSIASDGMVERGRLRRTESGPPQADNKKQYQLDIERILRGEDTRTTLMIKNIPNKYTSKMLLAAIDENHRGTYDFLYLPIDFKNKCNVGYAFINMTSPAHIIPIYQAFNGKKWEKFNSEKVASLAFARIQGKAALVAHFQNSSLMNEDKRCRPILFHSEGCDMGEQDPSSLGANLRTWINRDHIGSGEFSEGALNSSFRDSSVSGIADINAGGIVPSSPEKD